MWDVDLQNEEIVAKYCANAPLSPQIFKRGEVADAAPALANWNLSVDDLFAPAPVNAAV